jgi:hypothetical protein
LFQSRIPGNQGIKTPELVMENGPGARAHQRCELARLLQAAGAAP